MHSFHVLGLWTYASLVLAVRDQEVEMDEIASGPGPDLPIAIEPSKPRKGFKRAESQRRIRKDPDSDIDLVPKLETFVFTKVKEMFKKRAEDKPQRARYQRGLLKKTTLSGAARTPSLPEAEEDETLGIEVPQVEATEEFKEEYTTDVTSFMGLLERLKSMGWPDKDGEDLRTWSERTTEGLSNTTLLSCLSPPSMPAQGKGIRDVMVQLQAGTANRWQFAWGFFQSFGEIKNQIGEIRRKAKADPNGSDYNPACKELYDGLMRNAGLMTKAQPKAVDAELEQDAESELQMSSSFLETSTLCRGCYRDPHASDGSDLFNVILFAVMYYCYAGTMCGIGMIGPNPLVIICGLLWNPFR